MIDHSEYSCDKCKRENSWHCKHCWHTVNKKPTRFKPKNKTGCEAPKIKEFENYTNLIIVPRHDKLDVWKANYCTPYKDEILIGYNDVKVVYKLGDGIHRWSELSESTLDEVIALGYVYNAQTKYRVKLKFIPTRTMR